LLNDTSLIGPEAVQRKQQILMGHTQHPRALQWRGSR
jgi:hypothetical protein